MSTISELLEQAEAAFNDQRWAEAEGYFAALYKNIKDNPGLTARYALAVINNGDAARAATLTRRALRLAPDSIPIKVQLGKIYIEQKRMADARRVFAEVVELEPDNPEAVRGLTRALIQSKEDQPEAERMLKRACELSPDDAALWLQLGAIYSNDRSTYAEAERVFLHVLELAPRSPSGLHNYGLLKRFQGDLDTAIEYLLRAVEVYPDDTNFAFSVGSCYYFMEDIPNAIKWFERAIELESLNTAAHVYKAFCYLLDGRMKEGWRLYDKRLNLDELKNSQISRPRWDGSSMNGETLLLIAEQGMGDNLQFIRYAEMVAEKGGTVIVLTHRSLERLFKSLKGVAHITTGIPEPKHFHRYCPLMSLPAAFGTTEETVPANVPYLHAEVELIEAWREKLSSYDGFRVGICWRGSSGHVNDHFRSSSLQEMSCLFDVDGVTFFSLHTERPDFEQELPAGVVDIGKDFGDFADTAAAMENLDLIISVDTSVCHVAGAIGRPVWTLIPRGPDFRWGLKGETNSWYPSMRLFRQTKLGDWSDVYARIREALQERVDGRDESQSRV